MNKHNSDLSSFVERIEPLFKKEDYSEFIKAREIKSELVQDLEAFEKYSTFDVHTLEAVKFKEEILHEIDASTPDLFNRASSSRTTADVSGRSMTNTSLDYKQKPTITAPEKKEMSVFELQ